MSEQTTPSISDDPLYQLLREGRIDEFNQQKAEGATINLSGVDLRGIDLKGLDAAGIDFRNTYFRQADLRGIDFSQCRLEGASIHAAKISGCLFPPELAAEEIVLSLEHGTRMRYR
ncbi:pentapeptide repeat-containing protein [Thiohalobacter sp. IOR34]|uniref:pentapeptide repeat-containing protein n=1 Tax=Thiohalobacter sp. IOR34 TaxID=3057176 RepID=UPI0025AFF0AD|nr:pentapeptide repeat-containing protein [Thiohalobacter sp. IOR34]WJW75651.1 pentapeptide repeat-containing protein [Thiohalobacter sp. IOR34]